MTRDAFSFLRATFYRWAQGWPRERNAKKRESLVMTRGLPRPSTT
jgi:hypothetical protein